MNTNNTEKVVRPSALPILAICPKFIGKPSEATEAGTKRHELFKQLWEADNKDEFLATCPLQDDEKEGLLWAVDYILNNAKLNDYPIEFEKPLEFTTFEFQKITGTADAVCGNEIFDLKWREHDYTLQMAAYAYALLEHGYNYVDCHLMFAQSKKIQTFHFTAETASAMIMPIIENAEKSDAKENPNQFCSWCKKQINCPAIVGLANEALDTIQEAKEIKDEIDFANWTPDCKDARLNGKILKAVKILSAWCELIEKQIKETALKEGIIPIGFKVQSRQGARYIADVIQAYSKINLPEQEFLKACECNFTGLVNIFADYHKMKKAAAEKEVTNKLGDTIQRKNAYSYLVEE